MSANKANHALALLHKLNLQKPFPTSAKKLRQEAENNITMAFSPFEIENLEIPQYQGKPILQVHKIVGYKRNLWACVQELLLNKDLLHDVEWKYSPKFQGNKITIIRRQ